MRGQVLGVDTRTGEGMVAGDDGQRYAFGPADWAHRGEPAIGAQIDFETTGNRAINIFPMPVVPGAGTTLAKPAAAGPAPAVYETDRNKYVAALLAFFIGTLGIHRFYLGRTGSGVAMLILSITVVGLVISAPWALIDTIRYLFMSDREFAHRYARRPLKD